MNYLEEKTDGEAMINCIKNGDQPLPRVTQVSIAGTSSTEQPHLKDKSMWSDQKKKIQKIDHLARSLLIQGLSNDIYSLIDSNKTAKDLWDALARHMLGSEYGEQDRKAACGYSKDNCELNFKFLNNLEPKWKQYATMMRQNKNLMDINIDALYNILKQNQGDVNDAMGLKKKTVVITSDPLALIADKTESANKKKEFVKSDDKKVKKKDDEKKRDMSKVKCYNCKKEGHFAKDCKKVKVKDYEYYKKKMLLAKKDKDQQVLLAEDQAWMKSSSNSDEEINANMVFMAQIKKVLSDLKASSLSADDKIFEVSYYLSESESESEYETSEYYDNTTTYGLFENENDDQEIFHDCENFPKNLIESQIDHNESVVDHNDSKGIDKLIKKFNKKIVKCLKRIEKANQQNKDFEKQNKDLQDKYDVLKNQVTTFEMKNKELNEQLKVLIENNDDLLAQMKVLKDQLQFKHFVIDTHVECQERYAKLKAERYEYMIRYSAYFDNDKQHRKQIADQEVLARENKIKFAYDRGSLNASYVNEKINFSNDYFQEIINPDFDKIDSSFQQTSSLKPYAPTVILEKIIIDLEDEVVSLLEKEKENLKTIESLKSKDVKTSVESSEKVVSETENRSENDCQVVEKNRSSNNVKADLSSISHSKLNKNFKQYSRKNLMAYNNSNTRSTFDCNNARNALCNARMNASVDVNDLFAFDDVSIRKSHVSKMPFRKNPRDSLNVCSKSNPSKYLPRTVHRGTDLITGAALANGADLVTGTDLQVGTDLEVGTELEAGTDLVNGAGTDLVT
nr:hypothetical protein [Tanacetum cinerariifolium]